MYCLRQHADLLVGKNLGFKMYFILLCKFLGKKKNKDPYASCFLFLFYCTTGRESVITIICYLLEPLIPVMPLCPPTI